MCSVARRRLRIALFCLVGGLSAAPPVAAQTKDELAAQIDSLLPILRVAKERARVADSAAKIDRLKRNAVPTQEIQVGPLTILVPEGQTDLAREVMGQAWDYFAPFAENAQETFQNEVFTFQVYRGGHRANIYVQAPEGRVHRVEIAALYGRARLREKAGNLIAEVLNEPMDPELKQWGRLEAPWRLRSDDWLYRELVTSPAIPARECFKGRLESCWEAVGVVDSESGLWDRWYTAAGRLDLVRMRKRGYSDADLWDTCVLARQDRACKALLEKKVGGPEPPLSRSVRSSLLMFALSRGGRGSYQRLLGSSGDMRERLSEAAGMEPDALMSAWRQRVLAAKPEREHTSGRSRAAALAWLAVFGFLATRSTKWRLG